MSRNLYVLRVYVKLQKVNNYVYLRYVSRFGAALVLSMLGLSVKE